MNFLIHFYLAHFLADYTFQSSAMVKWKQRSFLGIFLHSSVHLMMLIILLFPFLDNPKVWVAIVIIYITHNVIDEIKVKVDKAHPKYIKLHYFVDQFAHWLIIAGMAWYTGELTPGFLTGNFLEIYTNQTLFLYMLVMVLSTYFYDVTRYFALFPKGKKKVEFKRNYKIMLLNAVVVTVAFGIHWLAY